jgi:uncharacterized protein YyaL (SSP411 family)
LIDLYEADFDTAHLQWAIALQAKMDATFYDEANGGYFSTSGNDPNILLRMKEDYDGAEPSPSSIATLNLLQLNQITGDTKLRERADKTLAAYAEGLRRCQVPCPRCLAPSTRR